MLLLQNSRNFRKIGLVLSVINIILQAICFLLLVIFFEPISNLLVIEERNGYYYYTYRRPFQNICVNGLIFFVVDIGLYACLIYGLAKRRPGFLQLWLMFSIAEFLIIEGALFCFTLASCIYLFAIWSIISFVLQVLVTVHLFHNMSVVYSAYHQFAKARLPNVNLVAPQINPNVVISSPPVQYTMPQYVVPQPQFGQAANAPTVNYPSHMVPNYEPSKMQQPPSYTT